MAVCTVRVEHSMILCLAHILGCTSTIMASCVLDPVLLEVTAHAM